MIRALCRRSFALLLALGALSGCGSQYADPILDRSAPAACLASYVAEFDGNAYATLSRTIQDDFTIEAWIRTASAPKGASFADGSAIVFADVEGVQLDDFASATVNDKFVFSTGGPDTAASSTSTVTTNQWLHVAITRKRSNGIILLFINGVLEGSAVGNDHSLDQSSIITLGGRAGRNFYTGLMSDVRLWGTIRSQSEIVANMHRRLLGSEDGLVGYYRLDDNAADPLGHDSSVSANDAAVTGNLLWTLSDVPLCQP